MKEAQQLIIVVGRIRNTRSIRIDNLYGQNKEYKEGTAPRGGKNG